MQLPPQADIENAATLAATLPAAVAEGSGVLTIDASQLKNFDTSTIALLLQAQRLASAAGRSVELHGAPAKLVGLAELYGVGGLLPLAR